MLNIKLMIVINYVRWYPDVTGERQTYAFNLTEKCSMFNLGSRSYFYLIRFLTYKYYINHLEGTLFLTLYGQCL